MLLYIDIPPMGHLDSHFYFLENDQWGIILNVKCRELLLIWTHIFIRTILNNITSFYCILVRVGNNLLSDVLSSLSTNFVGWVQIDGIREFEELVVFQLDLFGKRSESLDVVLANGDFGWGLAYGELIDCGIMFNFGI